MAGKTKRRPPKGHTWKTYMASIRPKGRKRHNPAVAVNPPRSRPRSRHHRRNPVGGRSLTSKIKGLPTFALHTTFNAGAAIAGKITARKVRGLAKQQAGTVVGSLIEAGVGLVGGALLSTMSPTLGAAFALGGVMAPMETAVQQLKIPHISDSLGDDGYLIGGDSGVTLVSAYADDYANASLGRYSTPIRRPVLQVVSAETAKHASKYEAA